MFSDIGFLVFLHNRCLFLVIFYQDSRTQVLGRIRSCCTLQVQKVTFISGEGFLAKGSSICTNFLEASSVTSRRFNVATSILPLSVTSRRGFQTSRRQFSYSLSRRDVDLQRRDVNFNDPLERRDVSNQHRDVDFNEPLERRDVGNQRRDVFNPTLSNVATLPRTSRRRLVPRSVTSRRCPERRDVALFLGQE